MPASHKGYKDNVLRTVEQTVTTYGMLKPKDAVVVGVSGGPDSVALLHVLLKLSAKYSLRLGVAHLNHSLRQDDSDRDANFVSALAKKFNLPCYIKKEDIRKYQLEKKLSLEDAARRVRHSFFNYVAEVKKFNKIALGHHSDDNAELVLMNLFRGSGPLGLSGIPKVRNRKVIRPLIELKRYELIDFLNKNGIKYVSDTSNRDTRYIRNRIRHNLIPLLQTSYNPKIIDTLNRLASIVSSEEEWMEGVILLAFKKTVLSIGNDNVTLSVPRLCDEHLAVQRRIIRKAIATIKGDLRRIRFSHIDSATSLLESKSAYGNLDFPNRIRIQRSGDILIVTRQKNALRDLEVKFDRAPTIAFTYKIEKPGSIFIEEIGVHLTFTEMGIKDLPDLSRVGQETAFFDWDSISFPLVLRNFQPGDRFKPLGVMGTQKVKKYFIDKKVSKAERVKCAILLSQGKIIWLVGYRIDETVKMIPSTKKVLKVELFLA